MNTRAKEQAAVDELLLALGAAEGGTLTREDRARLDEQLLVFAAASGSRVLSAGALEAFARASRAVLRRFFASAGHLVHYGDEPGQLSGLFEQVLSALRTKTSPGSTSLRPGDPIELVVDFPKRHIRAGAQLRVLLAGEDGTIDAGHRSLLDDFVVYTLPNSAVRRTQ